MSRKGRHASKGREPTPQGHATCAVRGESGDPAGEAELGPRRTPERALTVEDDEDCEVRIERDRPVDLDPFDPEELVRLRRQQMCHFVVSRRARPQAAQVGQSFWVKSAAVQRLQCDIPAESQMAISKTVDRVASPFVSQLAAAGPVRQM